MIKAVFFDIDNTLLSFDGYVKKTMKEGLDKFNIGVYNDKMFYVFTETNGNLWHLLEKGEITFDYIQKNRWNMIFEKLGFDFDGITFEKYFREGLFDNAIPEDGAMDILSYLEGKYVLCAASNGPYHQQINRLKVGGMLPFFEGVFISEDIGFSKPDKEFFVEAMRRLNEKRDEKINPEEIMIIGDSLSSDMAGGINSGLQTCFYNPKNKEVPESINYSISSLNEIRNIL